jgi:hypothetical protein
VGDIEGTLEQTEELGKEIILILPQMAHESQIDRPIVAHSSSFNSKSQRNPCS